MGADCQTRTWMLTSSYSNDSSALDVYNCRIRLAVTFLKYQLKCCELKAENAILLLKYILFRYVIHQLQYECTKTMQFSRFFVVKFLLKVKRIVAFKESIAEQNFVNTVIYYNLLFKLQR